MRDIEALKRTLADPAFPYRAIVDEERLAAAAGGRAFLWAQVPARRIGAPPGRPRLVALAALSPGVGRTTLARALACALAATGTRTTLVRVDPKAAPDTPGERRLAPTVVETDASALAALCRGEDASSDRPELALLDLPSIPDAAWARGLEAADDVVVLVRPGADDLSRVGYWFHDRLSRLWVLAVRLDATRPEQRRGLLELRARCGARALETVIHEDAAVAERGADVLASAPSSQWSEEVRSLARWVRSG